jgi:hypothetical protein
LTCPTPGTAYKEFPGRTHYTLGQEGWEEVADYALTWATENSPDKAPHHHAGVTGVSG